jgi:hypothetical protein
MRVNFEPWSLNLAPYLKDHPDERLIGADGKPNDRLMCLSLLLGEGWHAVRRALDEKLESVRPDTLDYDYEYSPVNGPHSCYCPRCLQAFRDDAKLPADTKVDPAAIKARYGTAWVDFMARRVARLFGRFRQTVHELSPATRFSVYSGYQTPDNPDRYGVDWRYVGQGQGCDRAGCGYGRPVEAIRATVDALQGIPLVCGALLVPYKHDVLRPVSPYTKAWLLRTLIDSTGGVLAYNRLSFDGRSWYAVAETTRVVAAYESVFIEGKRLSLPNLDSAQVQLVQRGNASLVCLMNGAGKPLALKVQLPAELGSGQEFYSGTPVNAGETRSYELAPGDAEVLVLTR